MLNPLTLYMLLTVGSSWMILSALLEIIFSAAKKVILDDFIYGKGIPFIFLNVLLGVIVM